MKFPSENLQRYIGYFSIEDEFLVGKIPLSSFRLEDFIAYFKLPIDDPMYDVYNIEEKDLLFISKYVSKDAIFEFDKYYYELCATALN